MPIPNPATPIAGLSSKEADRLETALRAAYPHFDRLMLHRVVDDLGLYEIRGVPTLEGRTSWIAYPPAIRTGLDRFAATGLFLEACVRLGMSPTVGYSRPSSALSCPNVGGYGLPRPSRVDPAHTIERWYVNAWDPDRDPEGNVPLVDQLAHALIAKGEILLAG